MVAQVLGQFSLLRAGLEDSWAVPWVVLLGLVICTGWASVGRAVVGRRVPAPRVAALLTVLFAVAWVLVDKRMEGPVLLSITDQHGITVSDLASVAAAVVAGWRLLRGGTDRASSGRARPRRDRSASTCDDHLRWDKLTK
jgi:hypothetical protein